MNVGRRKIMFVGIAMFAGLLAMYAAKSALFAPPLSVAAHEEDEKGEHVELSDAQIETANIEVAKADAAEIRHSVRLNGIIQPNQEMLVQVTPRFPGIARDIEKRVGDNVAKGELLARIESNASLTAYELRAPIAGTIIDRQAALGEYMSEQKPAFVIADLSTVWIDFSVYRKDLSGIQAGSELLVDFEDGSDPVRTQVSYVAPVSNSETQSAIARAVVENKSLARRPGLFVSGTVFTKTKSVPIAVKPTALQTFKEKNVVFVQEGQKFFPRSVEIGARDSSNVEILSGLSAGDMYAAKNSFVIKAELAKGEGGHED